MSLTLAALLFLVLVVVAGTVFVVVRTVRLFRAFGAAGRTIGAAFAAVGASLDRLAAQGEHVADAAERVGSSTDRLLVSLARLAVLRRAIGQVEAVAQPARRLYPKK